MKAGGVLVAQSDPHDGATLNESMADLKRHWMILEDALAAREKILEDALRHAIQFQASCGPLRNWIDGALPIVAEDQLVYGDTKIVDDLKAKHQVRFVVVFVVCTVYSRQLTDKLVRF